jgi:hypothetical protein
MTYSNSQATAGRGTTLGIGATPVIIGEIRSCSRSGNGWETTDVTNFESGISQEFISTILNQGEVKVSGNRVSTDAGQILVQSAFDGANAGQLQSFTMQLAKSPAQTTTGDKFVFSALVQSVSFEVEVTKEITYALNLKCSGAWTFTQGS